MIGTARQLALRGDRHHEVAGAAGGRDVAGWWLSRWAAGKTGGRAAGESDGQPARLAAGEAGGWSAMRDGWPARW